MSVQKTIGTILKKVSAPTMTVMSLTSIGEVGIESKEIDVTTLDSSGGYAESIPGLKDAGEVALKGLLKDDAQAAALYALAEAQTVEQWEIDSPNGSVWTFYAWLKMFKEGEMTPEGVRSYSASLRITGKPNYDPSTGASV